MTTISKSTSSEIITIIDSLERDIKGKIHQTEIVHGISEIVFDLPKTFTSLKQLSVSDAQLVIYSGIIERMEGTDAKGAGQRTRYTIRYDDEQKKLTISWPSIISEEQKNCMMNTLNKHRVPSKKHLKPQKQPNLL